MRFEDFLFFLLTSKHTYLVDQQNRMVKLETVPGHAFFGEVWSSFILRNSVRSKTWQLAPSTSLFNNLFDTVDLDKLAAINLQHCSGVVCFLSVCKKKGEVAVGTFKFRVLTKRDESFSNRIV